MDISDAFQVSAIQAADAALDEDETDGLREWVGTLFEERWAEAVSEYEKDHSIGTGQSEIDESTINEIWMEICLHSFMAGRAYQGESSMVVEMKPELASLFMTFLAERAK